MGIINNFMKKNKIYRSFALIVIFFLAGFLLINQSSKNLKLQNNPENIKYVQIAGQSIKVDLALTSLEQTQGLSGRNELKEGEGMLFVFEHLDNYTFWMKDMNFPIDIIWLAPSEGGDASKAKVIYIKKDARPESYPETYGPPNVPTPVGISTSVGAKYVLEVVSGFSEKNNLKEGDRVEFLY